MSYLTLALWAEGTSDRPFLQPLLRRAVVEHALLGRGAIDVAEDFIRLPDEAPTKPRDERICAAVAKRNGEISLLFIHTDAKGQPERARELNVQPAIERIKALPSPPHCISVVPKHETEAWMLADSDALGRALGVDPTRLPGVPDLLEVERHNDPKQCLNSIRKTVRRKGCRLPALDSRQIGETVRFDLLRHLSAFQCFEDELRAAMEALRLV